MKPLATSMFCPRDCDRKVAPIDFVICNDILGLVLRKIPPDSRGHLKSWAADLGDDFVTVGLLHTPNPGMRSTIVMTQNPNGLRSGDMYVCDVVIRFNKSMAMVVKNRHGACRIDEVPDAKD